MRLRLVTQECGETREQCRRTRARLRPSGYVMSRRSVVRCLGGVSAHRLPNTLKIGLGRVDSLETRHFMSTHFFPLPDGAAFFRGLADGPVPRIVQLEKQGFVTRTRFW